MRPILEMITMMNSQTVISMVCFRKGGFNLVGPTWEVFLTIERMVQPLHWFKHNMMERYLWVKQNVPQN